MLSLSNLFLFIIRKTKKVRRIFPINFYRDVYLVETRFSDLNQCLLQISAMSLIKIPPELLAIICASLPLASIAALERTCWALCRGVSQSGTCIMLFVKTFRYVF